MAAISPSSPSLCKEEESNMPSPSPPTPSLYTATDEDSESDYEAGDDDSLHQPSTSTTTGPSIQQSKHYTMHHRSGCAVVNNTPSLTSSSSCSSSNGVAAVAAAEKGRLLDPRLTPNTSIQPLPGLLQGRAAAATTTNDDDGLGPHPHLHHLRHHQHHHNQEHEVEEVEEAEEEEHGASFPSRAYDKAEELARRVWEAGWTVVHHQHLPKWLRDNDFLIKGHRPPLHSFLACFKSIFRIHTETGNIWTHLLGFIAFLGVATYFLTRPSEDIQWQEKAVFSAFFAGAILCLGFSTMFHTVYCHSERVGKLFNKLDYCGIALLTMGSFVPWLYYSFYCRLSPKIIYLVLILVLGTSCIIVSMWDKFAKPQYRAVRAGVFIALGLSGVIPAMHYVITDGFYEAINFAALGWLVLMAFLYITGAVIYAVRIPERIWPGKFDIWFQSHQIFHMFVIAAAFVHFHGISKIANYRLSFGDCLEES